MDKEELELLKDKYNIPKDTSEEETIKILTDIYLKKEKEVRIAKIHNNRNVNKNIFRSFIGRK